MIGYAVAQSQYNAIALAKNDIELQTQRINDYYSARTAAYVTLAIPLVLGAATAGLVGIWIFGTKDTVRFVPLGTGGALAGTF